jgi:hypothetical protein
MVDASGNTEITTILIHSKLNKKINKIGKGFQIIFDNPTSDFFAPSGISRCQSAVYFEVSLGDGTSFRKGANLGYY